MPLHMLIGHKSMPGRYWQSENESISKEKDEFEACVVNSTSV